MKLIPFSLGILLLASSPLLAQSKKELRAEVERLNSEIEQLKMPKEVDLDDPDKKAGYALGVVISSNIKAQGVDSLDTDAFIVAIEDVFSEREAKLSPEEAETILRQYMQQAMEAKVENAKKEATGFMEQNKGKEGVQQTESGLQYKVLQEGNGESPKATDQVTVHYKGMLPDGTVFDSSYDRGEPVTFGVNQVIKGWTEALQLMQEGDKWELYIPYELGYGERGAGQDIPPYSPLVFEVELLEVKE